MRSFITHKAYIRQHTGHESYEAHDGDGRNTLYSECSPHYLQKTDYTALNPTTAQ